MEVGEEFCGSKSEDLQESIRKQSFNYFKNYHASRLEELRIFLENESWEICPVKSKFDILQLQVETLNVNGGNNIRLLIINVNFRNLNRCDRF